MSSIEQDSPTNRNVVALDRRRAALLGESPYATWRAAPFLPALSFVLWMPVWLQGIAMVLPRTRGAAADRPVDAA